MTDAPPPEQPPISGEFRSRSVGMEEEYAHKNRLQEYTQRAGVALPDYQTSNEGSQHDPKFRSSVIVDGAKFVSPRVFRRLKEAEQYVAKFAFEEISSMIKLKGVPMLYNDKTFSKSILHEYAVRMRLDLPKYTTSTSTGQFQTFITSVLFDGKTFTGGPGWNVKDAEQIGARTQIEYILGQSETRIVMAEIIKSKSKLFNALHCAGSQPASTTHAIATDMTMTPIENHSAEVVLKEIEMQATLPNNFIPEHSIPPRMGNPEGQICVLCWGNIGRSRTVSTPMATVVNNPPAVSESNPPKASTSQPVYNISDVQAVQVKRELPLKPHITNPGVGGKRSSKNKSRNIGRSRTVSTPMATVVNNPPAVSESNPPKASTSQPVYNISDVQAVQVKRELPLKPHITNPGVGGKRSSKNKSRKNSKKRRADESSGAASQPFSSARMEKVPVTF